MGFLGLAAGGTAAGATSGGMSLGSLLGGVGGLAGGVGGIMEGIGGLSQAQAYYQTQMAQIDLQQQWLDMARSEANKADEWIKSYAGSFGQQDFAGYDWAYDFMENYQKTGKIGDKYNAAIEGRTKQMAEGLGKTYQAGGERLAEGLATRGISKESGLAADIASQYESTTVGQLNELMANKRAEYENEMKNYAQSLIEGSKSDPLFSNYTYNQETQQIEAALPSSYTDPEGNTYLVKDKSYIPSQSEFDAFRAGVGKDVLKGGIYNPDSKTGWMKDPSTDRWFYVDKGVARKDPYLNSVGPYGGMEDSFWQKSGYTYGVASDYGDYLGNVMSPEEYYSSAGIKSEYQPTKATTPNYGYFEAPTNAFASTNYEMPRATYKNYFKA